VSLPMRRWIWLTIVLLIVSHGLAACNRSTAPEKVDRGMFDKRKMPVKPADK
jgi:hypothetical protein